MVRLNIDFVDLINTDEDSGYILVIIDTFSKCVELYLCENATPKAAAECLLQHFSRYGALVGTEHVLTVAYYKEENAMVERANKEVYRHIRHVCFDRRTKANWRQTLPIAQRIINSHYSVRTGVSLPDIMFGRALDLNRLSFRTFWKKKCMPKGLSVPTWQTYLRLNQK